jgi:hypothetical protein
MAVAMATISPATPLGLEISIFVKMRCGCASGVKFAPPTHMPELRLEILHRQHQQSSNAGVRQSFLYPPVKLQLPHVAVVQRVDEVEGSAVRATGAAQRATKAALHERRVAAAAVGLVK